MATLGSKFTNVMEIPSSIVFTDIAFGIKVAGAYSPIVGDSVPTLTLFTLLSEMMKFSKNKFKE